MDADVQHAVGDAVYDLLFKLLEPDPTARAAHFKRTMQRVRMHAFLNGTDMGAEQLKVIGADVKAIRADVKDMYADVKDTGAGLEALTLSVDSVERRLGGVELKLVEIRDQLSAQATMTRELLSMDHELPTYAVFIPKARAPSGGGKKGAAARVVAAGAAVRQRIADPSGIFNDALIVHFVDPAGDCLKTSTRPTL